MQETQPTPPTPVENAPGVIDQIFRLPDWTPKPIVEFWELLRDFPLLGKLLVAALIVLFGYLAAKIVEVIMTRGLKRLTAKTKTDFDDRIIELVHRPVFIAVFFFFLAAATKSLGLPDALTQATVQVLGTLVVLVWLGTGFPLARLVLEFLAKLRDRFKLIEERTLPLFEITSKLLLVGGASYAALLIWGIDPTAWLASAGVIGIAVGFAAKDTLANLFGGFFIVADAPYKIGDFINLDSGERGQVVHVGLRSTRIETRDDIQITVPNAMIANAKIINESGGKWERERIRIKVGVAYGSDVDQVCEVLKNVAVGHDHICKDPEPRVRLRGLGDSSLNFELLCWIDEPVLRGSLTHDMYMDVYKALMREKIEIPYPKRDVYVHHVSDGTHEAQ